MIQLKHSKFINRIKETSAKNRRNYYFLYFLVFTFLYFLVSYIIYGIFLRNGKSLIWSKDALDQHLVSFRYFGNYAKGIIRGFFNSGKLVIPLWDSKISMGSDIITTLNYYIIGDPLSIFAIICPGRYYIEGYEFLCLFRIFLAGLSFSALCFYLKRGRLATLLGSVVYMFCYYSLYFALRHPFFMAPMYLFPLVLIGTEKILKKQSPVLFVVMISISAANNFYFFYMITIMLFIYILVRIFVLAKEKQLEGIFKTAFKFCGFYLIGVCLAAVLFLPTVMAFLCNGRIGTSSIPESLLFWSEEYYKLLIPNLVAQVKYSPIIFPCAVMLFMQKNKKYRTLKIFFILSQILMFIPIFGYIFNGFNYISDRWEFLVALTNSLILVYMFPYFKKITRKQLTLMCLFIGIAAVDLIVFKIGGIMELACLLVVMLFLSLLIFIQGIKKTKYKRHLDAFIKVSVTLAILSCVIIKGIYIFDSHYANYIGEFTDNDPYKKLYNSAVAIRHIDDSEFFRIDSSEKKKYNDGILYDYNSISSFFSTIDGVFFDFFKQTNSGSCTATPSLYNGFDHRTSLLSLASVKYYAAKEGNKSVPYGFKEVSGLKMAKGYKAYENTNFLPLGYTYSSVIRKEEFKDLSPEQKQQAMLESVYLKDPIEGYSNTNEVIDYQIDYEITLDEGLTFDNKKITISQANKGFNIKFKSKPNSETYIQIKNLRIIRPKRNCDIIVETGKVKKNACYRSTNDNFYCGIHDFMFNIGYSKNPPKECRVTFTNACSFSYDEINVISVPMDDYKEKINALKENVLENIKMDTNRITGDITLEQDKILCLSIPYSKGFSVKVNGQKTKLLKANIMYSAIPLKKGYNQIELEYETPYLKVGFCISAVTLIVGIALLSVIRKRKKKADFSDKYM